MFASIVPEVRPAVVAAREQNDNLSSIVRDFWMTDGSLEELKAYAGEVADNLDADVEIAINMINDEAVSWKISSLRQQLLHKHGQITELQRTHQAMVSKAASSANAAARQLALAKARGRQLGIEQQQYQAALQKSAEEAEADIAVRRLVATVFDNIVQQAASERARSLTAGAMQFAAKAGASMAARGLQSVQAALAGAAQIDQQIHVLCKEEQLNKYYVMADHGPVAGQLKDNKSLLPFMVSAPLANALPAEMCCSSNMRHKPAASVVDQGRISSTCQGDVVDDVGKKLGMLNQRQQSAVNQLESQFAHMHMLIGQLTNSSYDDYVDDI